MTEYRAMTAGEVARCVYNCLKMPKGSFAYNRELGSGLKNLDLTQSNYQQQAELLVKEALMQVPEAEFESAVVTVLDTGYRITVAFRYKGILKITEVRING